MPVVSLLAAARWAALDELARDRLTPPARELLARHAEDLSERLRLARERRRLAA